MKTAISLPDPVFDAAERLIKKRGLSRSEFYSTAIQFYVQKENKAGITEQLNCVYETQTQDEIVAGLADLPKDDWK